ncbi:non-ribosomal peptide synthetase [Streptosporangium carneum]|uniref:Non-ribosomal peptide synthetase n=1 Tax=Streptosporangium carneum TaxID=47481 RepID=A0A9W6MFK5_9ACTN|nr:non-ribosomal peptide synthetase [Streptosporangium carneum]GLK12744.1 non-ribosomal peptide synthetase [Streptosporangium carneum]
MTSTFAVQHALRAHPAQAEFWRARQDAWTDPTVLVRDHIRRDAPAPARVSAGLSDETLQAASRVTGDDTVLRRVLGTAVLALLAARATDRPVVTVFAPVGLPGTTDQAVPQTVEIAAHESGRELLTAVRAEYLATSAHLDVPLPGLLDHLDLRPGDLSLSLAGGLTAEQAREVGCSLLFDLYLVAGEARVEVEYDAGVFAASTAERLATSYARLLGALVADPSAPIDLLLGPDEQEAALLGGAFNDTAADFPDDRLLHSFLEERAAAEPDLIAVTDSGTTYRQLNAAANRLARALRERGVRPGDAVAVCVPRSTDLLVAVYGVLKAGGAYLPIDPTLPRNRIDYLLEHSRTSLVVAVEETAATVGGHTVLLVDDPDVLAQRDEDVEPVTTAEDICYIIYTSGSTGRPKGVMVEHRAIVNRLWWMQKAYPLDAHDVILHKTPFTFDVSVWEIFWWSIAGASVATLPNGDERDPERIIRRIEQSGVTTLHFVPSMLQAFLGFLAATDTTARLASVRRVFASGEALATDHALLFQEQLGGDRELINLYGPTEAAVDVTYFPCAEADLTRPVPIGRPISNIRLSVRRRSGALAPIGTPGELCISGVGLARGYLHAPDLTEERFVAPGGPDGERRYRTGDLARWLSDGTVEYLGRLDTQVKIRGYRIELGEIEQVAKQCRGVRQCAAAAPRTDSGEPYLVAYVTVDDDFDEAALRATFQAELPPYMVPQFIVEVAAIPTSHNGKRDLSSLPLPGAPAAIAYRAPRTPAEEQLAHIWTQVLGVERIGVDDNFFALGGDSIKFITVLGRARAAGLNFTFQELFEHPTIAELTDRVALDTPAVEPGSDSETEPFALVDPADRVSLPNGLVDAYPMSQLQVGLIYEATRSGTEGLYHDILSYRIRGTVDVELFKQAVRVLVSRHPLLRTSFHLQGFGEPLQLVHETAAPPLMIFDLRHLPAREQEQELHRFAELELRGGFRYGTVDLVRVHLHLLGDDEYQYSLSYHDAALDGWSVNTIHRDLFAAYFALLDGEDVEGRSKPVMSHRRYVELERAALASPEQGAFWQDVMDGAESTRVHPYTDPMPERDGVGIHDVDLPEGLSDDVVATARRLCVPVKAVLMAAHVGVLSFVSGSSDVLTGYEHSGRPEIEGGQDIAGLFLNTLPFRVRDLGKTWEDLVRSVYAAEGELLPYRRYPMAEIKKTLGSRDTLFETVFNFTHFHVLKSLTAHDGFGLIRSIVNVQSEFPFRAEFSQDAVSDEVMLSLHYHRSIYAEQQVERLGGYYRRALQALTEDPAADRSALTLMEADEQRLLREMSAGPEYPLPEGSFLDLFAEQARRTPSAVALAHGDEQLDYATLDLASDRVAAQLLAAGVSAGDVVTTVQPRGVRWALTMLALFKIGAVYLPQDRGFPLDRISAVLRRSGSRHLVAEPADASLLGAALTERNPGLTVLTLQEETDGDPVELPAGPAPQDRAYIIFTSGSTGDPKGATIRHSGMLNHLLAKVVDLELTEEDAVAQISTQCFDISVWQLLVAWLVGGRTVIYDEDTVLNLPVFLRALANDRVTVLETVPSYTDALLTEVEQSPFPLPDLRFNIINGEPLPPALTRRWFDQYKVTAINAYGPTECSDDVTHHFMSDGLEGGRVPIGRPIINTAIHVVGPDGRPRPIGGYGEICVTGAGVGLGYINDPERTAEAFEPNTLDDRSELLYRTGDIGRWLPSGLLDCAGRRDGQVKIRGYRIELSEVDGALDRLPGVETAVTLARDVAREKRLVTFYVGTAEPDRAEFKRQLTEIIPDYMHPEILIRLDAFPLNANGKIDRRVLAVQPLTADTDSHREPPADEREEFVRDLFASVLGLEPAEVGVTDNFFDIGGHSIAAMKVAASSRGRITLHDLLLQPTARLIAQGFGSRVGARRDLLVDLSRTSDTQTAASEALLVCVPFAGGGAISYVPLARRIAETGVPVQVLGVELPGRTEQDSRPMIPVNVLAEQLADEVQEQAGGRPVLVLGHCAGTSVAIHLVRALERREQQVHRLLIVAKLLRSIDPADHAANDAVHMSEQQIMEWLVDNTGLNEVRELSAPERADLARAFRYDAVEATHGLHIAVSHIERNKVNCPATVVLATDDLLMTDYGDVIDNWGLFVRDIRQVVTDHGGHYLNTTRPDLLAEVVQKALAG